MYSQDEEGPHTMGRGLAFLAAGSSESVADTPSSWEEPGLLPLGWLPELEEEATVLVVEATEMELAVVTGGTSSSLISPTMP